MESPEVEGCDGASASERRSRSPLRFWLAGELGQVPYWSGGR
jgi:hypothetical protein